MIFNLSRVFSLRYRNKSQQVQTSGDSGFESRASFSLDHPHLTRWPNGKAPDYGTFLSKFVCYANSLLDIAKNFIEMYQLQKSGDYGTFLSNYVCYCRPANSLLDLLLRILSICINFRNLEIDSFRVRITGEFQLQFYPHLPVGPTVRRLITEPFCQIMFYYTRISKSLLDFEIYKAKNFIEM